MLESHIWYSGFSCNLTVLNVRKTQDNALFCQSAKITMLGTWHNTANPLTGNLSFVSIPNCQHILRLNFLVISDYCNCQCVGGACCLYLVHCSNWSIGQAWRSLIDPHSLEVISFLSDKVQATGSLPPTAKIIVSRPACRYFLRLLPVLGAGSGFLSCSAMTLSLVAQGQGRLQGHGTVDIKPLCLVVLVL